MLTTKPSCIIGHDLANERIRVFHEKKKPILDRLIGYKPEIDTITYSYEVFRQLIRLVLENPLYDGLRVYFASYAHGANSHNLPAGLEDNLTLIFVPTMVIDSIPHTDDLSNIKVIVDGETLASLHDPRTLSSQNEIVIKWIKNFRRKISELETDGVAVSGNLDFQETCSLWFDVESFRGQAGGPDLVEYMDQLNLQHVKAKFACFIPNESDARIMPDYQMSLVFDLCPAVVSHEEKINVTSWIDGIPMDTGLPCPPRTGCTGTLINSYLFELVDAATPRFAPVCI